MDSSLRKFNFCHYLVSIMFPTHMSFFLLWNIKGTHFYIYIYISFLAGGRLVCYVKICSAEVQLNETGHTGCIRYLRNLLKHMLNVLAYVNVNQLYIFIVFC